METIEKIKVVVKRVGNQIDISLDLSALTEEEVNTVHSSLPENFTVKSTSFTSEKKAKKYLTTMKSLLEVKTEIFSLKDVDKWLTTDS